MALTKLDMAIEMSEEMGLNRTDAKALVESFFEESRKALEGGENIHLSGFGNYDLRDKSARPGRNPKTKEEYEIKARRVVTFHAGLKLKQRIQPKEDEETGGAQES